MMIIIGSDSSRQDLSTPPPGGSFQKLVRSGSPTMTSRLKLGGGAVFLDDLNLLGDMISGC